MARNSDMMGIEFRDRRGELWPEDGGAVENDAISIDDGQRNGEDGDYEDEACTLGLGSNPMQMKNLMEKNYTSTRNRYPKKMANTTIIPTQMKIEPKKMRYWNLRGPPSGKTNERMLRLQECWRKRTRLQPMVTHPI